MSIPTPESAEFARVSAYFRDPDLGEMHDLATASGILVDGLADPSSLTRLSGELTPLQSAAAQLAHDYTGPNGARVFDRLSTAQIHPAGNMLASLGHFAAAVLNNNTILEDVSPRGVAFEREGMDWLIKNVAGYDPELASGTLASGGTIANFTALLVARMRMERDLGWKADRPARVLATDMAHYSIKKAARMLAPCDLIRVDTVGLLEGDYRMDPRSLLERIKAAQEAGEPVMGIVAVAGETETGLVDHIGAIAEIAQKHGIPLHVDGAYGAPFRLSRAGAAFDGVEDSDSLTIDPHKYLYTPYPGGALAFREVDTHMLLAELNEDGERYLHTNGTGHEVTTEDLVAARKHFREAAYRGRGRVEGSMGDHAAVSLALVARHFGTSGVRALLDHTMDVTQAFAAEFPADNPQGLVPAHEPQLNTLCLFPGTDVRDDHGINDRVKAVADRLDTEHGIYVATTDLPDPQHPDRRMRTALRFVATSPFTTEEDASAIATHAREAWAKSAHVA